MRVGNAKEWLRLLVFCLDARCLAYLWRHILADRWPTTRLRHELDHGEQAVTSDTPAQSCWHVSESHLVSARSSYDHASNPHCPTQGPNVPDEINAPLRKQF